MGVGESLGAATEVSEGAGLVIRRETDFGVPEEEAADEFLEPRMPDDGVVDRSALLERFGGVGGQPALA